MKSEQRYANLENPGYRSILAIDGVDETLADSLFAKGIISAQILARSKAEDLVVIRAIDDEFAAYLIKAAQKMTGEMPEMVPAVESMQEDVSGDVSEAVQEDIPGEASDTAEDTPQEAEEMNDAGKIEDDQV